MQVPDHKDLSFEDRLGIIVDTEVVARANKKMQTRLKTAKLAQSAAIEDLEVKGGRGIDKSTLAALATSDWVRLNQNVIISGATGVGKATLPARSPIRHAATDSRPRTSASRAC